MQNTGRRRIYVILLTEYFIPGISSIKFLPYDEITMSNHRPIMMDMNIKRLFDNVP